eukprot:EG_transcript_7216
MEFNLADNHDEWPLLTSHDFESCAIAHWGQLDSGLATYRIPRSLSVATSAVHWPVFRRLVSLTFDPEFNLRFVSPRSSLPHITTTIGLAAVGCPTRHIPLPWVP